MLLINKLHLSLGTYVKDYNDLTNLYNNIKTKHFIRYEPV